MFLSIDAENSKPSSRNKFYWNFNKIIRTFFSLDLTLKCHSSNSLWMLLMCLSSFSDTIQMRLSSIKKGCSKWNVPDIRRSVYKHTRAYTLDMPQGNNGVADLLEMQDFFFLNRPLEMKFKCQTQFGYIIQSLLSCFSFHCCLATCPLYLS